MPELPEVETIVRALQRGGQGCSPLLDKKVTGAIVLWARTIAEPRADLFVQQIVGQSVRGVSRRGKFIRIDLDRQVMLIHLRMSGDIRVEDQVIALQPHDRLILNFVDGTRLAFNDARKFGRVWLVAEPESVIGGLGLEPLERSFTPAALHRRLQNSARQIKPLLLDQTVIAGIGNIYADEALHMARIHPMTPARKIDQEQTRALWDAIREVLREGIRRNGASIDWVYRGGDFQNYFRVYQRSGRACPECGTTIERVIVGQRGTHICPCCQVMK
ncbi:MAG: bifunctional DNA-formamidopyrimidine glycosylase/DNA-(apurinic or apyrimidinic site) lyase [Anaerolineae bacterium]|nr:bifunctional DNA-formamidopyrimidine glycosylase/DNA-(apurinic or apyrimidinic site) lyase [Anaerolineae bacterium]